MRALAQYVAREGHHPAPRSHAEEIAVEDETAPVPVKLGVWITNTKSRRDKLTPRPAHRSRRTRRELGVTPRPAGR